MKRRRAHSAARAWDIFWHYRPAKLGLQRIRQDAAHHIRHAANAYGDNHAKRARLCKGRGRQTKRSSGEDGTTQHRGTTFRFCKAVT
jgi:hypothetical protein